MDKTILEEDKDKMKIKEKVLKAITPIDLGVAKILDTNVGMVLSNTIDLTLAEVGKVVKDVLSRDSKKIILSKIKETGIPRKIFFTEKKFFQAIDFMKEELKQKLGIK